MYLKYWNLSEKPFENTPDPKFLYGSPQHEEGMARLLYGIQERKGAAMLTGIFGCGKTLMAYAVFSELGKSLYQKVFVVNPLMGGLDLLRYITHELSGNEAPSGKADVLVVMKDLLLNNANDGKHTVIVIDEAHIINDPLVFEEIRLLLNMQLENRFLVTILLLGQPELVPMINNIKQLSQRIPIRYHLGGLKAEETANYVGCRLSVAGGKKDIFDSQATSLIHTHSGGIPRRINQIADMALFIGFSQQKRTIDAEVIKEAIVSLKG